MIKAVASLVKTAWLGGFAAVQFHSVRPTVLPLTLLQCRLDGDGGCGGTTWNNGRRLHHAATAVAGAQQRGHAFRHGLAYRMTGSAHESSASLEQPAAALVQQATLPAAAAAAAAAQRAVLTLEQHIKLLECTTKSEVIAFLTPHLERALGSYVADLAVVNSEHAPWPLTFTSVAVGVVGEQCLDLPSLDLVVCRKSLDRQQNAAPYSLFFWL
jgi:hypothetical protein